MRSHTAETSMLSQTAKFCILDNRYVNFLLQENVAKHGQRALNLTTDFDETAVMKENLKYITQTLDVSTVDYYYGNLCEAHKDLKMIFFDANMWVSFQIRNYSNFTEKKVPLKIRQNVHFKMLNL